MPLNPQDPQIANQKIRDVEVVLRNMHPKGKKRSIVRNDEIGMTKSRGFRSHFQGGGQNG